MSSIEKRIGYIQRSELDDQNLRIPANEVNVSPLEIETPLWLVELRSLPRLRRTGEREENANTYFSRDVLAGLNGQRISLYFLILGREKSVHLYIGTMATNDESGPTVRAVFNSQYPGLKMWPEKDPNKSMDEKERQNVVKQWKEFKEKQLDPARSFIKSCQHIGVITGIPTPNVGKEDVVGTQVDRLIRGFYGTKWAFLVLAEPEEDSTIIDMQLANLKEQIRVEQEEGIKEWREKPGQTIAIYYSDMLQKNYQLLENCLYEGGWLVQSYICSPDLATYSRAKALVKSIFSGDLSRVDRIRVLDCPEAGPKVANFSTIVMDRPIGYLHEFSSGKYRSFKYHTLVSSGELSSLIHLPQIEMPGYFVKDTASFDVSSHVPEDQKTVEIGEILDKGHPTGNPYRILVEDLTRHCLLVGITGSGKTNTAFYLLQQLQQQNPNPTPFLVIEPAKREYRKIKLPPEKKLQVFTLGEEDEKSAPFRLNPFEIRYGVNVQTHIDLLKSVFNASFGLFSPLPQILERAIHEIYRDKGWDPIYSNNKRAAIESQGKKSWHPNAHPTLTNLYLKVVEMVPKLGYSAEIEGNIKTALETRINSLRVGAKGIMMDTQSSIPIECLLDEPTVLELEGVGDDDEKAFIMGLILMTLYEYYQVEGGPYLFSWDEIPGNDNMRLLNFLKKNYKIDWVTNAAVEKIENGMTIRLSFEKKYLLLSLNDEKTKVTLKIDDIRTYELIVKTENDKLKIISSDLRHITVVEEAHRLLINAHMSADTETASPRGKAVETFVNMLSEIRAYGEGFLIAEQIPTKLAPDVIKNTALKIMHRTVANDDREIMGGTMNLTPQQVRHVVSLGTGEAVVHGGGDDNAILVKVPDSKGKGIGTSITDTWKSFKKQNNLDKVFLSYQTCISYCVDSNNVEPNKQKCADARRITENTEFEQVFASFILSIVSFRLAGYKMRSPDADETEEFYKIVHNTMLKHFAGDYNKFGDEARCIITHSVYRYMDKYGRRYGWKYKDCEELTSLLLPGLMAIESKQHLSEDEKKKVINFCEMYGKKCRRDFYPFEECEQICPQYFKDGKIICLYRYNVESVLNNLQFNKEYEERKLDPDLLAKLSRYTDIVTQLNMNSIEYRSVALCLLIQKVYNDESSNLTEQRETIKNTIASYDNKYANQ